MIRRIKLINIITLHIKKANSRIRCVRWECFLLLLRAVFFVNSRLMAAILSTTLNFMGLELLLFGQLVVGIIALMCNIIE